MFEEGAYVEKGQQLYQIDEARYLAQLNSTRADLKSAQANLKTLEAKARRYDDLVAQNAVSKQEYDDVIAQKTKRKPLLVLLKQRLMLQRLIWATPRCMRLLVGVLVVHL